MNITLNTDRLVDDILADSALNAIFNNDSALLTTDRRPALRCVAVTAAATVAGELLGYLKAFGVSHDDSEINFDFGDTEMSDEALKFHLITAVSLTTLRHVAISIGDHRRADAYRSCASDALTNLRAAVTAPPHNMRRRPSYY